MKILNYVMAAAFIFSVIVQFNDPDPLLWMLIYGLAGAACVLAMRRRGIRSARVPHNGACGAGSQGMVPELPAALPVPADQASGKPAGQWQARYRWACLPETPVRLPRKCSGQWAVASG